MGEPDFLVGEWDMEIPLPNGTVRGHAKVERLGEFLVQRTTVERPEFPDMEGRWERSDDEGSTWEHDFDMNFRRRG